MAAFNFPNSPSTNDLHTENGVTYKWNGTVWKRQNTSYTDATNLNVTGISTFAGNVSIADKIIHTGDTNTAIRFPSADTITAETGGSERFRIKSDGKVLVGDGGSITQGRAFEVRGTGNQGILVGSTNNNGAQLLLDGIGGGDGSGGNYGALEVPTSGHLTIRNHDADKNIILGTGSASGANDTIVISDGQLVTQKGTWTNTYAANNTTQCGYQVHNQSDTTNTYAALRLTAGVSSPATAQIASVRTGTGQNDLTFQLESSNTAFEALRIKSDGKIGVGINAPGEKLDVSGWIQSTSGLKVAGHPIATYAGFTDISGGSYAARLGSTGSSTLRSTQIYGGGGHIATFDGVNQRLGINITAPAVELDIKATSPEIRLTCSDNNLDQGDTIGQIGWYTTDPTTPGGAGTVSYINTFSANGNGADYSTKIFNRDGSGGGSTYIQLGNALGAITFGTNTAGNAGTERLRIRATGQVEFKNGSFSDNVNCVMASGSTMEIGATATIKFRTATNNVLTIDSNGHTIPGGYNGAKDLGSSSYRWRNVYTSDIDLCNESRGGNEVDGTWGAYTIQEGEDDLFLINRRSGKKYKFNLTEVS